MMKFSQTEMQLNNNGNLMKQGRNKLMNKRHINTLSGLITEQKSRGYNHLLQLRGPQENVKNRRSSKLRLCNSRLITINILPNPQGVGQILTGRPHRPSKKEETLKI